MTEIIKNNSSIKFDLLETGNGVIDQPERGGAFNTLFGGMGTGDNANMKEVNINDDEIDNADGSIAEIVNILKTSELNLSADNLADIKSRLQELIDKINLGCSSITGFDSKQINSSGDEIFVHIMKS